MNSVESQLAEYFELQEELYPEITSDEVTGSPVRVTTPARPSSGIRWAIAAAAITVLVIGGTGLLARIITEPDSSPVADDPVVTTTQPATTSTIATGALDEPRALQEEALSWSRLSYDDAVFGGYEEVMDSVTVGGPGFVAVGQAGPAANGEGRAAVWTSADGIAWSRVPHKDEVFDEAAMHSVTAGGPGLVAVGTSDRAAVWTSTDGFTWSRIPHDDAVFGGVGDEPYTEMNSVTAGGPGLVAVGIEGHPHGPNNNAAVWTSVDGVTWSRVPHTDAIFGRADDRNYTELESVTVGGPGLVAVGGSWSGVAGQGGAAVWTSVDGVTWSRVPHSDAFSGGGMSSVAAGGPGLVAVGWDDMGAAVWTSVDGVAWSRVPHDGAVFDAAAMNSVTTAGPGLVAVGTNEHDNPRGADLVGAVVWTSLDGITWSRTPQNDAVFGTQDPSLPALEMRSVAASGSRLVAVGANKRHDTFGATKSDAAVWVSEQP